MFYQVIDSMGPCLIVLQGLKCFYFVLRVNVYRRESIQIFGKKGMRCIWGMTLSNSGAGSAWGNEFSYLISNLISYPEYLFVDVAKED